LNSKALAIKTLDAACFARNARMIDLYWPLKSEAADVRKEVLSGLADCLAGRAPT
jgi:hypothetical protein